MPLLQKLAFVSVALIGLGITVVRLPVPVAPDPASSSGPAALSSKVEMIRKRHLPNLGLTDHEGHKQDFYNDLVRGKVVVINFMYAACSKTCEIASQNMARLQEELGDRLGRDVSMYSVSLDVDHDTPAALAAYRSKLGAKEGWTFLLPQTAADAAYLRRKLGVYEADPVLDGQLSAHTGMVVVGNEPRGRWTTIPSLVHPIRLRQAVERMMLQPEEWVRGEALVQEVPREDRDAKDAP
jgi:protein SCO1